MRTENRREFLKQSLLGLSVLPLSGIGQAAEQAERNCKPEVPLNQSRIDAHSHIWTQDTDSYPLVDPSLKPKMEPLSFTAEELTKLATTHGIGRVVLIQHMGYHGFDNSYITDTIAKYPGRFSGVAGIDDTSPDAAKEMKRLKQLGIRGFRIRPGNRDVATWLDGPAMKKMWTCGADENLAICFLIDPNSFPGVEKMCKQFPETPVVIDHFGRIGADGKIRKADVDALCDLAKFKQVSVKVSAFYAFGKKQPPYKDLIPMIRRVIDAYGVQRLMWASDCPYQSQPPHTYAASIALLENAKFLSDDDREWLFRKTAEKVYFS